MLLLHRQIARRFFATTLPVKDSPAEISDSRFLTDAARALERIFEAVETASQDAETSLHEGVLKIQFTDGTFIINKHALTKQLWYSSPVIGPAYFDALTTSGRRWYSLKLERDVFDQFALDVKKLANIKLLYPPDAEASK